VHEIATRLSAFLLSAGPLGLVLIGALDSSFLVLPLGNDMLLAALAAQHPDRVPIYVVASALGSACGVLLVDLVFRKGGEKGLSRFMKPRQIENLKQKIERHAAVMLVAACLAPPPFPFTAVVAGASGLQYPRMRLLGVVAAARAVRFLLVSLIAVHFGTGVLRVLQTPQFFWFMAGFAALCIAASAVSLVRWIRIARRR
jgi:membrane protein YqaA with SNARE-associated domain